MLSIEELSQLIGILSDTKEPLETLGPKFFKNINKTNQFKLACAICILLQDKMLGLTDRLVGTYILYKFQNIDLSSNPFLPILVSQLHDKTTHITEKYFIATLFSGPKEVTRTGLFPPHKKLPIKNCTEKIFL